MLLDEVVQVSITATPTMAQISGLQNHNYYSQGYYVCNPYIDPSTGQWVNMPATPGQGQVYPSTAGFPYPVPIDPDMLLKAVNKMDEVLTKLDKVEKMLKQLSKSELEELNKHLGQM